MMHGEQLGQTPLGAARLGLVRHRVGQETPRHAHSHVELRGVYVEHSSERVTGDVQRSSVTSTSIVRSAKVPVEPVTWAVTESGPAPVVYRYVIPSAARST